MIAKTVSIIVPYYNVEAYFKKCLTSLACQTMTDLEVLLIDDCGQDNSTKIAEDFISHYDGAISFRIIHQEKNQGQSAARNRGIVESTGKYIYFLDSDDYISPDCIQLLLNEMEKDSSVEMVIGNYKIIGPQYLAPFSLQQRQYHSDEIIREQLAFNIYTMPWNKLIRRDFIIRNNLFFVPGVVHEDNLWCFCTSFCFNCISVVLKPTYYYIIRTGSTERSHTKQWHQQQLFEVYQHLVKYIFLAESQDKKDVKNNADVFHYVINAMTPFVMEPYLSNDENLAFLRYSTIRKLPFWDSDSIKHIEGVSREEKKKFKHWEKSIEKGFKEFVKTNKKYTMQTDINSGKISVITINYNNLKGLQRTIPSITGQTYTGYQFIVIDGGSDDGSLEYLQSQERIDCLISEKDSGIYNAMNKGVKMATNEYCIFMNSGDTFFASEVLQLVVPRLSGADFYTGCGTIVDGMKTLTWYPAQTLSFDLLINNSLCHQSTFSKTSFLKEHPFDESFRIVADWELFVRSALLYNCSYEPLSDIMVSIYYLDGISSTNKALDARERDRAWQSILDQMTDSEKKTRYMARIEEYKKGNTVSFAIDEDYDSNRIIRQQKNKDHLSKKISSAMSLPPLQRDWKILRNAVKTFFRDLFA